MSVRVDRLLGINSSVAVKAAVKAATTANITLYGAQTIDDISCVAGDRVLVKDQTTQTENGIYDVSNGTWVRSADFDGTGDVVQGTLVFVFSGTAAAFAYRVTTANDVVIGTSNITFEAVALSALGDLSLTLSSLASGDLIKYNGSNWVNFDPPTENIQFQALSVGAALTADHTLEATGNVHFWHTATANDEHAMAIENNADGFGNVSSLAVFHTTGAIAADEEASAILVSLNSTLATGGSMTGLTVSVIDGSADIYAVRATPDVNPLKHDSGAYGNMDSVLVNSTDRLTEFTSAVSDIEMFSANGDTITIGNATKFSEISFDLATAASGAGIKPTFEYSTGVGTWASFSPTDGTNGMKQSGVVSWSSAALASWAVGTGAEYLIRITRTQNTLATAPIENLVQIAEPTVYSWDKNGDVDCNNIVCSSISFDGGATSFNTKPIYTESFTSAEQTVTSSSTTTVAHGLSGTPKLVQAFLICKTGEHGYSVNDIINATGVKTATGSGTNLFNFVVGADSTNVFAVNLNGISALNKSTQADTVLTNGNWKLILRAAY